MRLLGLVMGAVALVLTSAHLYWLLRDQRNARASLETRQHLRRLAALTIRNFPARDLETPDLFWKSIGREDNPMKDHWGTDYRLRIRPGEGGRDYSWSSAGPDKTFGTRDDVSVEVPFANGPSSFPDLGPGEDEPAKPINGDAR